MQRIDEDTIYITQQELDDIQYFIDQALDTDWDHHTSHYICSESWEDGKRRMNPAMYDFAQQMLTI